MGTGAHKLWYNHPAKAWTEALPLGNGSLGAMVYGGVNKETVFLNLDTLWSGYPGKYETENKVQEFKESLRLVMEDKPVEAMKYIEKHLVDTDSEWYLLLGKLIISSRRHVCPRKYRRELDISTAVNKSEYISGNTLYKNESFISFPDKVFVYRMTAEGKHKLSFSAMISSELKNTVEVKDNTYILKGVCPTDISSDVKILPVYLDGDKKGIEFSCLMKIETDGKIIPHKNHILIEDASEANIYLTAESSFEAWNKLPSKSEKDYTAICRERISRASSLDFNDLKKNHISDHKKYYDRVSIDLGNSKKESTPTNRRLHEFIKNKENDNDLYCLLFNYGRYLTIAASREGSQAMNLQGIWTYRMHSPWKSNYTVNINTEMNYWPTLMCSLPEMYNPLVEFIKEIAQAGTETAEKYYGAGGFCCHHNVDIWRKTTPSSGLAVWSFWPMSGAWFCRSLYEKYEYSGDKIFLKETALPVIKSATRFCLDMLIEDRDGYLIFAPSVSPENNYRINGQVCSVSKTAYMTMEIIRDLFGILLEAEKILGENDSIAEEVRKAVPKLLPFRTDSEGRLLEWYSEEAEAEVHHRHVSHLYALHPAHIIDVEKTPDLAKSAEKTLERRGDNGTGWSLGWKINFWARLRNKEKVLKLIDNQLRYINPRITGSGGGTFPNMFDAHPPFQIDGNFGAASGIAEALMQSQENRIIILPALPDKWADGHIHGLTAKGNVRVDIDWKNGKLAKLLLDGHGDFDISYNGTTIPVKLNGKKEVEF